MRIRVTMEDVAKAAGVSVSTVSYVVNNGPRNVTPATRRRVLEAIARLNYRPNELARSLKTNVTLTIGVIFPDATQPFFSTALRGILDTLDRQGYLVLVCSSKESLKKEKSYLHAFLQRSVDGLIITPARGLHDDLNEMEMNGIPTVVLGRWATATDLDSVATDNREVSYRAVRLLIESGHRRIGLINGPMRIDTTHTREEAYRQAHQDCGIPVDENLIYRGEFSRKTGVRGVDKLFSLESPPTAIFTGDAMLTLGALQWIAQQRLAIPDDIAIISYGDPEWASIVSCPLTVVEQPGYLAGSMAANVLLNRIDKGFPPGTQHVVLDPRLVVRESHKYIPHDISVASQPGG